MNNPNFSSYLESEWLTCIPVGASIRKLTVAKLENMHSQILVCRGIIMLSYFLHAQLWAHAHRQVFHCGVDTNNITESFNHVLRQRYLPLRHDTTIFALVQILVEVVFPEQEIRYIQATIKQTAAYLSQNMSYQNSFKRSLTQYRLFA